MVYFRLSWLPWIFAIGGILGMLGFTDGMSFGSSLLSFLIGGAWLYYVYIYQRKQPKQVPDADAPEQEDATECECGAPLEAGMMFCGNCGKKVG